MKRHRARQNRGHPKTVYVFGAGCSYHAGIPVTHSFWKGAEATASQSNNSSGNPISHTAEALKRLTKLSRQLCVFDNVEQLFAFLEVARDCGIPAGDEYDSLLSVLSATIGHSCRKAIASGPDRLYSTFVDNLFALNESSGQFMDPHYPDEHLDLYTDTVVTFNYDILLEHALCIRGAYPYYALDRLPTDESFFEFKNQHPFRILKPHGSLNWLACDRHPHVDWAWSVPVNAHAFTIGDQEPNWAHVPWKSISKRTSLACPTCGSTKHLRPVMVAPGYAKQLGESPMKGVWNTVIHELYRARRLVIIGYSLPPTDFDFENMLLAARSKGSRLKQVEIVNPDTHPPLRTRYKRLLRRLGVEDIKWTLGATFEDYVLNGMS